MTIARALEWYFQKPIGFTTLVGWDRAFLEYGIIQYNSFTYVLVEGFKMQNFKELVNDS